MVGLVAFFKRSFLALCLAFSFSRLLQGGDEFQIVHFSTSRYKFPGSRRRHVERLVIPQIAIRVPRSEYLASGLFHNGQAEPVEAANRWPGAMTTLISDFPSLISDEMLAFASGS